MNTQYLFPKKWPAIGIIFLSLVLPFTLAYLFIYIIHPGQNPLAEQNRIVIIGAEILIAIPAFIYAIRRNYPLKPLFRLRTIPFRIIGFTLFIGISTAILSDEFDRLITMILHPPDWLTQSAEQFRITTLGDFLLLFGGIAILSPISEEFLFRGFLQTTLEFRTQDVTKAILTTALAFALVHMNAWWIIQIYLFGIILSYLSWRSQSILPGIIVHMCINGMSIGLTNLQIRNQLNWYTLGDHVSPVWLVISGLAMYYGFQGFNKYYPLNNRESETILPRGQTDLSTQPGSGRTN